MPGTTINGRQYEFADLTVVGAGRDIIGLHGIEYKESQDKELIYGKGNKPVSIQRGNKSYEGTLTVLQSELEGLAALSESGSILDLDINLSVCYGDPALGTPMTTDLLFGVQFTEMPKGLSQGDKNMEVALPFLCTDIQWNA